MTGEESSRDRAERELRVHQGHVIFGLLKEYFKKRQSGYEFACTAPPGATLPGGRPVRDDARLHYAGCAWALGEVLEELNELAKASSE